MSPLWSSWYKKCGTDDTALLIILVVLFMIIYLSYHNIYIIYVICVFRGSAAEYVAVDANLCAKVPTDSKILVDNLINLYPPIHA
jgi:hypothetical protein